MIYETPGATFHARADGFDTGITGTIGVRIIDSTGAFTVARTTSGIIENPAGSGSYLATLGAPLAAGDYTIFWDSGSVSPSTTSGEMLRVSGVVISPTSPTGGLLASADDLSDRLGGLTFSSAEAGRAVRLLSTASDLVRAHCKQTITLVTDDVLTIPGSWSDRILLPERPVVDVSSVTATFYNGDPVTLPTATFYVDRDELVRYPFPVGLQHHFFSTGNGWLGPGYRIAVTYTHGYDPDADPVPAPLALSRIIALEMVARVWVNPEAATQSQIGDVRTVYPAAGMLLTDEEKKQLSDVFRRTSQTVTLR